MFFCIPSLAADPKATAFLADAQTRFDKRDYVAAVIQAKNALQQSPNYLDAVILLGKSLLGSGEVAAAEVTLGDALTLGADRASIVIPLGQSLLAQGKHKLLFEQQRFALGGLPVSIQAQMQLLRAAGTADVGDLKEALKMIQEARRLDPKLADTWLAEVSVRIRMRQFKEATEAVERAFAIAPNGAETWYQKGSVMHVAGDAKGALAAYDRAIKTDADHHGALTARAGMLIDLGRNEEASKDLAEIRRLRPEDPKAAYLRALISEKAGKPEETREALKEITELLDQVPLDMIRYRPQVLMLNGLAHYGLKEPEKALIYFETFQKVQADAPTAKLLAQIYLRTSNFDRAVDVLERYLKAQPTDGQALALLGSALMGKGQTVRAASLMQQALQTKESAEFRTILGLSLLQSGKTEGAIKELEAALKTNPGRGQAATSLVALYFQSGQSAKALVLAERLAKQQPNHPGAQNMLGMVRANMGNTTGARAAFDQAIRLRPSFTAPKLNLAKLDIAEKAFTVAEPRLQAILKAEPKNPEAMFEMALVADGTGRVAETQAWLEKAIASAGPRDIRYGLALSDFHLRYGQVKLALNAVKSISARAPDDLTVLLGYAKAQLANGDSAGAKISLGTATRVAEYDPVSQVQIATLQLAVKNLPGATYSVEKALSTKPDYFPALAMMAELELRNGNTANAEKRAHDLVVKFPKQALGYSILGDVHQSKGQATIALDTYRKAYQIQPSTENLSKLMAASYPESKDPGKNLEPFALQWLKTNPKDGLALRMLGDHYARAGNFAQAKVIYETIAKLTPDDAVVLNNLANVLFRLKDGSATKVAEQAVSKAPQFANASDTLGWLLFQDGQTERAKKILMDAKAKDPFNPEIRYHLGAVLAKAGQKTEARIELLAATQAERPFESKSQATELLKTIDPQGR